MPKYSVDYAYGKKKKGKPRGRHGTKTDEVQSVLTAPAVASRYNL